MDSRWRRSGKNQVILVKRLAGIHASGNERPGLNGQNWRHAIESAWFNFREGALFVSGSCFAVHGDYFFVRTRVRMCCVIKRGFDGVRDQARG
jgi:hypothetical protein